MPKFTDPSAQQQGRTLVRKLIGPVDKVRDLLTKFGMRPYTVRIIRAKWSGGERGIGTAFEVPGLGIHILPVPKITDLEAIQEIVTPVGLDEVGSIMLSGISGRYTEEQLRGLDQNGNGPGPDEEFFYEIEFVRTDGKTGELRRFFLRGAPQFHPGRVQWHVRLERSHADRDRDRTVAQ